MNKCVHLSGEYQGMMGSGSGVCLADWMWSGVVVAPLVVTYWRGTWDLLADMVSGILYLFNKYSA